MNFNKSLILNIVVSIVIAVILIFGIYKILNQLAINTRDIQKLGSDVQTIGAWAQKVDSELHPQVAPQK